MRTSATLALAVLLSCAAPPQPPPPAAPAAPPPSASSMTIPPPPPPTRPPPPPPGEPPVTPSTVVAGVRARRPPVAPPKGSATERVTIPTDGRATVLGLEIEVRENIEKRDMDGSSLMRIHLHVKAGREEAEVHLTSENVLATWQSYELEYTGGWRQDLSLKITKLP